MMDMTDEIIRRIKERAKVFVIDNIRHPTLMDFIIIENAMLIGSMVRCEVEMEMK